MNAQCGKLETQCTIVEGNPLAIIHCASAIVYNMHETRYTMHDLRRNVIKPGSYFSTSRKPRKLAINGTFSTEVEVGR
jgi:hypothetical protein